MKIQTDRTYIIPFTADHIDDIVEMLKEPDSNKFIEPMLNRSESFYREKLTKNIEENKKEFLYWSAYCQDTDRFVGTLNLNTFELSGHDQVGVHLARGFWNKGYGYELSRAMINYAFDSKKLEAIHWVFELPHEVSKKLALKLGFSPYQEMMDGDCPLRIYKLEKKDWKNG